MDNIDKLKKDNEILRKALVRLVGSEAPEELAAIEAALRLMPMNEDDKAASINAIHAIIGTQNATTG